MGFFDRFRKRDKERLEEGLEKTRTSLLGKLDRLIRGKDQSMTKCWTSSKSC